MGQTREQKIIRQVVGKPTTELRTPIATNMFLPNHSGIATHPEFIASTYWDKTGTVLTPKTSGDSVLLSGLNSKLTVWDLAGQNAKLQVGRRSTETLEITSTDTICKMNFIQDLDEDNDHQFIFDMTGTANPQKSYYRFKIDGTEVLNINSDGIMDLGTNDMTTSGDITGENLTGTVLTATQATIDHDSLANFVANEHIDWTAAASNFDTTGTGQFDGDLNTDGENKGSRVQLVTNYNRNIDWSTPTTLPWFFWGATAASTTTGLPMARAGSIVDLAVQLSVSVKTANGSILCGIWKNNTLVLSVTFTITSTGVKTQYVTQARGTDTFAAGDYIGVSLQEVDTNFVGTTQNHFVSVGVQFDT